VSADDCDVLLGPESIDQSSAGDSDLESLADQADQFEAIADDVSDKKLAKGLRKMAGVYAAASKAKSTAAAGIVIAERSKTWAKGYKVYAKALNRCTLRSLNA
jgi:hypothetical protein